MDTYGYSNMATIVHVCFMPVYVHQFNFKRSELKKAFDTAGYCC